MKQTFNYLIIWIPIWIFSGFIGIYIGSHTGDWLLKIDSDLIYKQSITTKQDSLDSHIVNLNKKVDSLKQEVKILNKEVFGGCE